MKRDISLVYRAWTPEGCYCVTVTTTSMMSQQIIWRSGTCRFRLFPYHGNIITWKRFPHYWHFVRGIYIHYRWISLQKWPVMRTWFSLLCVTNNQISGDLRPSCDVIVMKSSISYTSFIYQGFLLRPWPISLRCDASMTCDISMDTWGLFYFCPRPMRDGFTLERRLSLARCKPRIGSNTYPRYEEYHFYYSIISHLTTGEAFIGHMI